MSSKGIKRASPGDSMEKNPLSHVELTDEYAAKLQGIQRELARRKLIPERRAQEFLLSVYEDRRSILKGIPKFWAVVLMNHNMFAMQAQHNSDQVALSFLEDVWVARDSGESRCFTLEFHFKENPYFSNRVLKKEYRYMPHPAAEDNQPDADGITQSMLEFSWKRDVEPQAQKIDWKDDSKNLTKLHRQVVDVDGDDMPSHDGSFFNFFEHEGDPFNIGVLIVNDIFPEAINYFLGQARSRNMVEDDDLEDKVHLKEQRMKKVKKSVLDQDVSDDMDWEREIGNKDGNNDQEDIEMVQLPDQGEDMEVTQLLWDHVIEDMKASLSTEELEELRKEVFGDEELSDMSDNEDVEDAPSKSDNQDVEDAAAKSNNQDVEDATTKFHNEGASAKPRDKRDKKRQRCPKMNEEKAKRRMKVNLQNEAKKMTERAEANKKIFDFNFAHAVKGSKRKPANWETWDDNTPRSAYSSDGQKLVYHLPRFIKARGQKMLINDLHTFFDHVPPMLNGKKKHQYTKGEGVRGEINLVRGWHGIGQSPSTDVVPSRDFVRSATALRYATSIVKSMELLSLRINSVIEAADPKFYESALSIRKKMEEDNAFADLLGKIDPLVMEGREILVNGQSPKHTDRYDPPKGWVIIVALGSFTGGSIRFTSLGLTVRMLPGDAVMMRGRVLPHEVENWDGIQRISIPHFTHSSIWKRYGMYDKVDA